MPTDYCKSHFNRLPESLASACLPRLRRRHGRPPVACSGGDHGGARGGGAACCQARGRLRDLPVCTVRSGSKPTAPLRGPPPPAGPLATDCRERGALCALLEAPQSRVCAGFRSVAVSMPRTRLAHGTRVHARYAQGALMQPRRRRPSTPPRQQPGRELACMFEWEPRWISCNSVQLLLVS